MKSWNRIFLISMSLLTLASCASIPKASIEETDKAKQFQPIADKSVVYVYRNEMLGGAVRMDVVFDNIFLGDMRGESFMRVVAKPGNHIISSRAENTSQINVKTEKGKIYYVWLEAKMGLMYAGSALHQIDDAESAQKAIRGCDLVQHIQP